MDLETARTLFAYNRWAQERTLGGLSALPEADLVRQLPSSFGSIHATLTHGLGAEWVYLQRWAGSSPSALPNPQQFPDLASLREFWETILNDQTRFLSSLQAERLREPLTYINLQGQPFTYLLGDQILQLVNHSTYHRGQVSIMQRLVGAAPIATDYLLYLDLLNSGELTEETSMSRSSAAR